MQLVKTSPWAAYQIKTLPWVADGWQLREPRYAEELVRFALEFPETFILLIDQPWVTQGFDYQDSDIVERLTYIENHASPEAAAIIRSSIFRGSYREVIAHTSSVRYLAHRHPGSFEQVWQVTWIFDGVRPDEWPLLRKLVKYPDFLTDETVWQLPWTQDDFDANEQDVLVNLARVSAVSPDIANDVIASLLLDTIEPEDSEILAKLVSLISAYPVLLRRIVADGEYTKNELDQAISVSTALDDIGKSYTKEGAEAIAEMPFLQGIEPWDLIALESLQRLAHGDHRKTVMGHSAIQDGITDREAKVVATLHGVMKYNPKLLDQLLSPNQTNLEERAIDLPLAGKTLLTIIRIQTGSKRSMDFLEHAVRTAEEYTKVPFPTRFVAYLFADAVGDAGGRHFGTNIISKPYADGGDDSDAGHIAHEVGHYYWGGDRPWLNEAGASFIEYFSELERTGRPVESRGTQCPFFKTIKAMELAGVRFESHESRCIYALGQQFMLDMYYGLGDAAFRQGLHNFLTGNVKGISGLTQSFKQPLSPEKAFFVDLAVAEWFGPTPLIGPGFLESPPPDPLLTAINGRIEDLKLNLRQRDENYRLSSDDEREAVQLTVEFSHHVNGLFELPLKVAHVAENGSVLTVQELTIDSYDRGVEEIEIPLTKEPGQYSVVLVEGNRKVAEVSYVITP